MLPPLLIPGTEGSGASPYWSVMIPAYNPRADYLEQTLRSVLQQDPGPERMQIEVIDDCSNDDTASEVASRIGAGRVTFHVEPQNRGLANTWNRCLERARGDWVHILHQDDIVLPGFYDLLRKGAEHSDAGALFCRCATHPDSATSGMRVDATDARDVRQMIELTATYHTPARGRVLASKARLWWAEAAVFRARELLVQVGFAPAWRQIVEALRLSHNRRVVRKIFSFLVLWFRIMGSRLKRWMKSKLSTSFTAKSTNDDPDCRR